MGIEKRAPKYVMDAVMATPTANRLCYLLAQHDEMLPEAVLRDLRTDLSSIVAVALHTAAVGPRGIQHPDKADDTPNG